MSWYREGTANFTNGSRAVVGIGTDWLAITGYAHVSNGLRGPDGKLYEIEAVTAPGALTLVEAYQGPTAAGADYAIAPMSGLTAALAQEVSELIATLPSATDAVGLASASATAAADSADMAAAARDAALQARSVFPSAAVALTKGVRSLGGLVAGSGGTNGTFDLALSGGGGAGAAGRFVVAGGKLESVVLTAPGSGYTSAPALSFAASSGLTGASAVAVIAPLVEEGGYFGVPSTVPGEAAVIYRVVAGAAVEQYRTSTAAASGVLTRVVPFKVLPPVGSTLERVHLILLDSDVDLSAWPNVFVEYCFRDEVAGTPRFNFILSAWSGSAATRLIGVAGSMGSITPDETFVGQIDIPLVAVANGLIPARSNGDSVGTLRFDFRDGANFGGTFAFSDAAVYVEKLQISGVERRDISRLAQEVVRTSALSRLLPFKRMPKAGSPLLRAGPFLLKDDVDLSGHPTLCVHALFRDAVGSTQRFNLIVASGEAYTNVIGVGTSGSHVDPEGFTGERDVTLVALGTHFPGYSNGQPLGTVRVDFGSGEHFGTGTFTHDEAGLYPEQLKVPVGLRSVAAGIASAAAQSEARKGGRPFVPQLNNDFLRQAIRDARIYGRRESIAPPAYGITYFEAAVFTGFSRVTIRLSDLAAGQVRCEYSAMVIGRPLVWGEDVPRFIRLVKGNVVDDLGHEAVFELDTDFIAANTASTARTWSTVAECGFDPSVVITAEAQMAHRHAPRPGPVLSIGIGGVEAVFEDAMSQLYAVPEAGTPGENFAYNVKSHIAHFDNPVLLRSTGYRQRFQPDGDIVLPPHVDVDGGCAMMVAPTNGQRFFEENFSGTFACVDAVVDPANASLSGYWSHCDPVDGTPAGVKRTAKSWWHVNHLLGVHHQSWGRGCGLPDGMIEDVRASHGSRTNPATGTAIWGYHNSPNMTVGARLTNASSSDQMRGAAVVVLTGFPSAVKNVLDITGSDHAVVAAGVTMVTALSNLPRHVEDRNATRIVGRPAYDDCAIGYEDLNAIVLKVPAGSVVTGPGAAELFNLVDTDPTFGAVDKYGLGRWTPLDGSIWSVATRLGDRRGSPLRVSLTLPGGSVVHHDLASNYTSATLAAVVAELNGSFGAGVVTIERWDRWVLPQACRQRRGWNNTGTAMPKGRRVRFVEAPGSFNEIRPAADDERADGFLLTPCVDGDHALVVMHRAIPRYMLPEVTGNGPVYASGGLISSTGTDPDAAGAAAAAAYAASATSVGSAGAAAVQAGGASAGVAAAVGAALQAVAVLGAGAAAEAAKLQAARKVLGRCVGDVVRLWD